MLLRSSSIREPSFAASQLPVHKCLLPNPPAQKGWVGRVNFEHHAHKLIKLCTLQTIIHVCCGPFTQSTSHRSQNIQRMTLPRARVKESTCHAAHCRSFFCVIRIAASKFEHSRAKLCCLATAHPHLCASGRPFLKLFLYRFSHRRPKC